MVSYNGEWNLLSKLSWYPDITPNCVPFQDIPKPQFWRCIPRTDADWNVENRCSTTRCVLCVHITHESLIMMTIMIIIITMLVTMMMIYDLHRWYIIVLL